MSKQKHTHKYIRVIFKDSGGIVYKCALPACTHFIRKELVVGRMTICWACGSEFVLTANRLIKKPTCGCKSKLKKLEEGKPVESLTDHYMNF